MANAQQLVQQALKLLAAGDETGAISLLGDALEQDGTYLPAWIKLAELMPDDDEKFDVLEQILQIDPNNEFALTEWDRLNALAEPAEPETAPVSTAAASVSMDELFGPEPEEAPPAPAEKQPQAAVREAQAAPTVQQVDDAELLHDEDEAPENRLDQAYAQVNRRRLQLVSLLEKIEKNLIDPILGRYRPAEEIVPGISRRDMGRTVGGLLLFTAFMCMCSNLVIGVANSGQAQILAEQTRLALEVTGIALTADANRTQVALDQTAVALSVTETAQVLYTPLPTLTNTPFVSLPTEIPPSETPTEAVITSRILPPPPASAVGRILAWGGNNPASRQFLFLQSVDLASGEITRLNEDLVTHPSTDMLRSQIIYSQYDARNNETLLVQVNGANPAEAGQTLSLIWSSASVREEQRAALAASGNYVAFIARTENGTNQVFLYDFLNQRLRPITRDSFNYLAVGVAPGGSQVVVVKETASGVDLVLIELYIDTEPEFLPQTLLTTDGNLNVEDAPQYSPSGLYLVYHSTRASSSSSDVILFDLAARTGVPIAASDADERYPHFSPDNRFIAYSSNATSAYNVFIYDTISQATFQLTESPLAPVFVAGWSN
jgi:hypothetical protein